MAADGPVPSLILTHQFGSRSSRSRSVFQQDGARSGSMSTQKNCPRGRSYSYVSRVRDSSRISSASRPVELLLSTPAVSFQHLCRLHHGDFVMLAAALRSHRQLHASALAPCTLLFVAAASIGPTRAAEHTLMPSPQTVHIG